MRSIIPVLYFLFISFPLVLTAQVSKSQNPDSLLAEGHQRSSKAEYEKAGFINELASWYITEKNDTKKALELVEGARARVLMEELAKADNKFYKKLDAEKIMGLLDRQTAILEYAFSGDVLIRFLITSEDITGTLIDSVDNRAARDYITEEVKAFRNYIMRQGSEDHSQALYQILLPDKSELDQKNISNLLVIPDGVISLLPFEALKTRGRYLIQQYNIKYLPSASIYPYINPPSRNTKYELLAVAGSGFERGKSTGQTTRSQNKMVSLPSTLIEVDSIAKNFNRVRILRNEDVTERNLKAHNLNDFRFLHFATHGNIDVENPSQSGLVLSTSEEAMSSFAEDGHLKSVEISNLKLKAELVTLSACNSGMGKMITGEGLLGLQRSFLSAGSSSVIVSLWSIFDRSTSVFMSTFYKSLLKQKAQDYGKWKQALDRLGMYEHPMFDYKAKALREAKLEMIDHPYYNHPVYWAPFILIGK